MTILPESVPFLRRAAIVVGVAWVLSILIAYLSHNGWWFIAWWPVLVVATWAARWRGHLGNRGRHESEHRDT